jgi:outer membrane protein OmpA-like peptidoglycan-associated protein
LTDEQIKDIRKNMVFFETADDTASAFFSGKVDAAATWEPYLTQAASSTNSRILFDTSMGTNLVMDGLIFSKNFAKSHEEFIVKLIDGALEANSMYLNEVNSIRAMPMFKLMEDSEIREMCEYASVATWADNMSILRTTCLDVYKDMSNIWISIGEKADPSRADSVFTDKYVSQLKGKYSEYDITSFAFSSEGRKAAEQIANNASLLSVTLNIEFETDSYKIKSSSYEELNDFAQVAKLLNGCYIQIEGNTAKVDGDDGREFSYKRALSVAKYLQALGIDPARFIIIGNGDKKPIATNSTEEGKQQNRRTEVFFKQIGY